MHVRALCMPGDAEALAQLDTSFSTGIIYQVNRTQDSFTLAECPTAHPIRKRYSFADELDDDQRSWSHGFVADVDGIPRGFAAVGYKTWNRRIELCHFYVDSSHRGRGLATALLEAVRAHALRQGAREIWLETQNVNRPGILAYRSLGFQLCGLDTSLYDGVVENEVALYFHKSVR